MSKLPNILVVDDQIGVDDSEDQKDFLSLMGVTDDSGNLVSGFPYAFRFVTGMRDGKYSIDATLENIRRGWNPGENRLWALVLLDMSFGQGDSAEANFGLRVLQAVRNEPDLGDAVPVVMLTSKTEKRRDAAIGKADGFMPKVLPDGVWGVTRPILEKKVFELGLVPDSRTSGGLIGNSLAMLQTLRRIRQACHNGVIPQMCLLGESGVGKTVLAQYAHGIGGKPMDLFRDTKADASNSSVYLGELFGAWPGAYTSAPDDGVTGQFELAHGGTLFLDEVAHLNDDAQKRLLEARTHNSRDCWRTISRYGAPPVRKPHVLKKCWPGIRGEFDARTGKIRVDVSLITAANAALDDEDERRKLGFRDDLWFKLEPAVRVPNLNERRSDMRELFTHLLRQRFSLAEGEVVNVDEEVFQTLEAVNWSPRGNIRGLQQIANSPGLRYSDFGVVTVGQLPADLLAPPTSRTATTSHSTAQISTAPLVGYAPADFGAELVRRYRADLELLVSVLEQTRIGGDDPKPAQALARLLGKRFSGADIKRTIKTLFIDPVFPTGKMPACLLKYGLVELQTWVLNHPLLKSYVGKSGEHHGSATSLLSSR